MTCFRLGWGGGKRVPLLKEHWVVSRSPCGRVSLDSRPDGTGTCFILCDAQMSSSVHLGDVALRGSS